MCAALQGDQRAYRELLAELAALLRRYYAKRLRSEADAEDLVQETLMAIHTRRATYDASRPVTAWAHAIARYKLVDHFRRARLRATVPLGDASEFLAAADDATPAMARRDLARMLDALPAKSRQLLEEMKLDGRSVKETAARTGLSESAVKTGLHRALKSLAVRFGGKDQES